MKLAIVKLRAICLMAFAMGLAVQSFHRMTWKHFTTAARAIWSIR